MHDLFPLPRSLTGDGVRQTFAYLQNLLPNLAVRSIRSGQQVFDWTVPKEWRIRSATLTGPSGDVLADFSVNNLHVVGYSTGVDRRMSLEDLRAHLYSVPEQPDAIPYVTSYYRERWGFCLPHRALEALPNGEYHARIDAELFDGELNYGELLLPGEEETEVLLSTYICHPSMANNELSGPAVTTAIARWLASRPRRLSYRIVFVPETIGALVYMSRHLDEMKRRMLAGFVVTCIGDDRTFSMMPSRRGDTAADRAGRLALKHKAPSYTEYSFLERGSDERQYCSPGADLPVASIMRSRYGTYPEYHTSLDDMSLVTPSGLQGGFNALATAIGALECNENWRLTCIGEPMLGKRGLYPDLSGKNHVGSISVLINDIIAYADGSHDFIALCEAVRGDPGTVADILARLLDHRLIEKA